MLYTRFRNIMCMPVCIAIRKGAPMSNKVRVNISISEETHHMLKQYAASTGTNVSKVITDLIRKESTPERRCPEHLCSRTLIIGTDTDDRLQQWAYENHTTVDQTITDWIWKLKVKENNIKGQFRFY